MKIRNGFVSNSSSSSFVLAVDKEKADGPINITIDISSTIDRRIFTKKELDDYFVEQGGYSSIKEVLEDDEWTRNDYLEKLKLIQSGKVLLMGSGSNEDDGVGQLIYYNGIPKSENYEIVEQFQ